MDESKSNPDHTGNQLFIRLNSDLDTSGGRSGDDAEAETTTVRVEDITPWVALAFIVIAVWVVLHFFSAS